MERRPRGIPHAIQLDDVQGVLFLASTGSLIETVGAGALWVFVAFSCAYASWSMASAFLDARDVVDRRKDKPEKEEEERQRRIDKLFGRK